VVAFFIARTSAQTSMYDVTLRRDREEKERIRLAATQMHELVKPADTVVALDADVKTMTRVFLEYPVKYLYVVDADNHFRGVVALKDITSDLLDERDTTVKSAADYLQPHFDVLTPNMSLGEALQHFLAFQGERLPVIDCVARPMLLGVVYKTSLLDAYFRLYPASR